MSLNQAGITNTYLPVIDDKEVRMAVLHRGVPLMWFSKLLGATKCPDGWDDISNTHDRDCTTCTAKSGYSYTTKPIKAIFQHMPSHAMYTADNIITVAGKNERADAEMYTTDNVGRNMRLDDIITHQRNHNQEIIEYTIMTKRPVYGTRNKVVYYRFLLFKSPELDTVDPLELIRL